MVREREVQAGEMSEHTLADQEGLASAYLMIMYKQFGLFTRVVVLYASRNVKLVLEGKAADIRGM